MAMFSSPLNPAMANLITFLAVISITVMRLYAVFVSPLDLSVDEAQYWLWSLTPEAGYFTKPPMIAWLISIGTSLAGSGEAGIRLMAPIFHGITALILWKLAGELYHPMAGRLAALGWVTLPAVGLASVVMSTDTPLLLFTSVMILALSPLAMGRSLSLMEYSLAGIMLGLGFLSKYAAIYSLISIGIIWLLNRQFRQLMRLKNWVVFLISALIVVSPNLIWNWQNGFATITHLEHNANIREASISIISGFYFLLSQAAVIGPILLLAAVMAIGTTAKHKGFLLAFMAPPLIVITIQASISEANANWAILAWPPAIILVSGWLCDSSSRLKRSWWLAFIGASNIGVIGMLWLMSITGSMGILTPSSDPLRHLRGWDIHHADISAFIAPHSGATIITDRRVTTALLTHRFRNTNIRVRILDNDNIPSNHYEAYFSFSPSAHDRPVIPVFPVFPVFLVTESRQPLNIDGVAWTGAMTISQAKISDQRERIFYIFEGMDSGN